MAAVFKVRHCTCASCHSTLRLPSALRAVKGCHPPCDFQSTTLCLAGIGLSAFSLRCAELSHFHMTPDTSLRFDRLNVDSDAGPHYVDERVLWLRNLLDYPMPLTECLSPAGYLADLQDGVRVTLQTRARPLSICAAALACGLGRRRYPSPSWFACWFALDPGTTRSVPRPRFPTVARGPVGRGSFPAPCITTIPELSSETPPGGREDGLAWIDPCLRTGAGW